MKIGELARRTGISIRMLRYYEDEGLLNPQRTDAGYRDYSKNDEQTAKRIQTLSKAGLKLDAIRTLLPCVTTDAPHFDPCPKIVATLRTEIDTLDRRIVSLQNSRETLSKYLSSVT